MESKGKMIKVGVLCFLFLLFIPGLLLGFEVKVEKEGKTEFSCEPSFVLTDISCPYYIETGDLNNDGLPDLVVSSWFRLPVSGYKYDKSKSRVYIFYNKNGKYQLPPDKEIAIKEAPWGLKVGDFDNDGKNDLAVVGRHQHLHLFLGKEDLSIDHDSFNNNQWGVVIAVGKINKEGICDFLVGPVWRKWFGGNNFRAGYFHGPKKNDNGNAFLSDLNQDSAIDVIFTAGNLIRIYYGPLLNMRVSPTDASEFIQLTAPSGVKHIEVADLNNDGRADIIAATGKEIYVYYQNAPIGFTDKAGPSFSIEVPTGYVAFATGDLNKDGLYDLVVGSRNKIYIFKQKREKGLAKNIQEADYVLDVKDPFPIYCLKLDDINKDGFLDIITSTAHGSRPGIIRCFINKGEK